MGIGIFVLIPAPFVRIGALAAAYLSQKAAFFGIVLFVMMALMLSVIFKL